MRAGVRMGRVRMGRVKMEKNSGVSGAAGTGSIAVPDPVDALQAGSAGGETMRDE